MKKLLLLQLKIVAQKLISKYKPVVISITGSIGKTSTKEAIYHILKNKFFKGSDEFFGAFFCVN